MEILRLATAGSVDDGKSTLIGRLLYDSKTLFEDQLEAAELASIRMGEENINLALITDGLRAEREQGITIDVAYRYFATQNRKFIIADTPGHIQYTRNMVTGASTADLALVLVDVRNGVLEQSKRHAFLSSMLGVPHLTLCVNKMDLVDYDKEAFEAVKAEFREFATRLNIADLTVIPISALHGDNVVNRSETMNWYEGPSLLHHLDELHIASDRNLVDARFPVQYVLRPRSDKHHDYRGYGGQIASGVFKVGDEVMILPSGFTTTISEIRSPENDIELENHIDNEGKDEGAESANIKGGKVEEAFSPMSVTISLADDLDVSRGDMICRPNNQPNIVQDIDAMICWMDSDSNFSLGKTYAFKHTTKWVRAKAIDLNYRLDVNTLHRQEDVTALKLNDIGRIQLRATAPIFVDEYQRNRATGSFILVDESNNRTVAAGMIRK